MAFRFFTLVLTQLEKCLAFGLVFVVCTSCVAASPEVLSRSFETASAVPLIKVTAQPDAEGGREALPTIDRQKVLERKIADFLIEREGYLPGEKLLDIAVAHYKTRLMIVLPGVSSLGREHLDAIMGAMLAEDAADLPIGVALRAATAEATTGADRAFEGAARAALDGTRSLALDQIVQDTALRAALEAARGAAQSSDIALLESLELEYSLDSEGIETLSVFGVQPLYQSDDLFHTVMAQGSYGLSGDRRTGNLGIAYRFMTDDAKHLLGANVFIDHEWPAHHSRLSLGAEYRAPSFGVTVNHYAGLSEWRNLDERFEEKALSGTDATLSGRSEHLPDVEFFLSGYHWNQERTTTVNPDGDDIWGYELAAEYQPVNGITVRSSIAKDNAMDRPEGKVVLRLSHGFGENDAHNEATLAAISPAAGEDEDSNLDAAPPLRGGFWDKPVRDFTSVADQRFAKVRRDNTIRKQERLKENPEDATPDAFGFIDQIDVALASVITSGLLTIDGITVPVPVSVSGDGSPELRINGGSWVTTGNIKNGQSLELRLTSSASFATVHSATLTVGGVSDQWDVTTVSDPCSGSPTPGDVCADGSVYAGLTPNGNVPMYTTPADQSSGAYWGTRGFVTGSTSLVTGEANTADVYAHVMAGDGTFNPDDGRTPNAAVLCENLVAHGHNDWYLPAEDELDVLYDNRVAIGGFGTSRYWSSSELNGGFARNLLFSNGFQTSNFKSFTLAVRCVRR